MQLGCGIKDARVEEITIAGMVGARVDKELAGAEVKLIMARMGLRVFGEEKLYWQSTLVVTDQGRQAVAGNPGFQYYAFDYLVERYPQAVAVRLDGSVHLPRGRVDSQLDPLLVIVDALSLVRKELRAQIFHGRIYVALYFPVGLLLLILAPCCFLTLRLHLGVVCLGASLGLMGSANALWTRTQRLGQRQRQVRAIIRGITQRGELPELELAELLTPAVVMPAPAPPVPQPPPIPPTIPPIPATPPPIPGSSLPPPLPRAGVAAPIPNEPTPDAKSRGVSAAAIVVFVFAFFTMLCPLVGTTLSILGLFITRRQPLWIRILFWVVLAISLFMDTQTVVSLVQWINRNK